MLLHVIKRKEKTSKRSNKLVDGKTAVPEEGLASHDRRRKCGLIRNNAVTHCPALKSGSSDSHSLIWMKPALPSGGDFSSHNPFFPTCHLLRDWDVFGNAKLRGRISRNSGHVLFLNAKFRAHSQYKSLEVRIVTHLGTVYFFFSLWNQKCLRNCLKIE